MTARALHFVGPHEVEVEERPVPTPDVGDVRVRTLASAISAGTEGLIYRGEAPTELPADETIDALEDDLSYPLKYGYAAVGRVDEVGPGVSERWLGRRVFAYNPHESHFVTSPESLVPVPDGITTRRATLLANVETAITFHLDGRPTIGECVVVFGQGVVGLLTTALLAHTSIGTLVAIDPLESRRSLAERLGADLVVDPSRNRVDDTLESTVGCRADLTYELSGNPDALELAIAATGFDGRVVVGSWYGTKTAELDLGRRFHRDRIEIRSSQVSTIAPEHEGRWSRERRHQVAWQWLEELDIDTLFTHEFSLERAGDAYRLLDEHPEETIQVVLTYD